MDFYFVIALHSVNKGHLITASRAPFSGLVYYLHINIHEILPKYHFPLVRLANIRENFREIIEGDSRTEVS